MKRTFGFVVVDSDDEEADEPSVKRGPDTTWRAETPAEHHDMAPASLSPFVTTEEAVSGFPQQDSDDAPPLSVRDYFSRFVDRTPDACAAEAAAPQRSVKWKEARKFALTGSDFGAASGSNPYSSQQDLVTKKLWNSFAGNDATKWGSTCEPLAGDAFLHWAKSTLDPEAKLHSFGLLKWSATPWLAVSPDGVLEWTDKGSKVFDLVEFKCPTRISTEGHPYGKYPHNTPPYYRDQMLGIWGLANENGGIVIDGEPRVLRDAWFVVWQPTTLWVTLHSFSADNWTALRLLLRKWYFGRFLPALVWHYHGQLEPGEAVPTSVPLDLRSAPNKNGSDLGGEASGASLHGGNDVV